MLDLKGLKKRLASLRKEPSPRMVVVKNSVSRRSCQSLGSTLLNLMTRHARRAEAFLKLLSNLLHYATRCAVQRVVSLDVTGSWWPFSANEHQSCAVTESQNLGSAADQNSSLMTPWWMTSSFLIYQHLIWRSTANLSSQSLTNWLPHKTHEGCREPCQGSRARMADGAWRRDIARPCRHKANILDLLLQPYPFGKNSPILGRKRQDKPDLYRIALLPKFANFRLCCSSER